MPQPELNISWNLEVSIINTDRKSTRSPLVLTQEAGKGSSNAQRKCGNPTSFSFFLLFSFSPFSCTPGLKQWLAVALMGADRSLNLRERGTFLSNWRIYGLESGANPVAFLLPLLFCWFALTSDPVMRSTQQIGVNEAPSFCWKAGKGECQRTRRFQENEDLGNWPFKVAYGLLSWLPRWACVSLILNRKHKCWGLNYGIDRPPPSSPKLDTTWDSYETHNWI